MRLAIIAKSIAPSGGTEIQVLRICRQLAERGHDVHVFCKEVLAEPPPGVVVVRMPRLPWGSTLGLLAFSAWARRATARHGPFDVTHSFHRTLGQQIYRLGGGCHRSYLEHAHALDRPWWIRAILRRTPRQWIRLRLEEASLRAPTTRCVITNSAMVRNDLIFRYGLPLELFQVIRNGTDLIRFRPASMDERTHARKALALPEDSEVVLFLGSGYARKGLQPALAALARLKPWRPRLHLLVAGRDRRPRFWEHAARRLGVADRTVFLGASHAPEALFAAADLFVLPTSYDAAANATLEALASGLPVVTSRMDGASEIVDGHDCGTVVPVPVHPGDVADAVASWLDRPDLQLVARRARARAEEFSVNESTDRLLAIYAGLAAQEPFVSSTPSSAK